MVSFLEHISRRGARLAGAVLLLLVVAFFAATRTEIGRDAVARQIEAQFARSTSGELRIGRLTGNLVQSFTATDVRVLDASGQVYLAADTVFVRPSWDDLLRRRFEAPRIQVRRPRLHVPRDSTGNLTWRSLLPDASPTSSNGQPWSFQSARLLVEGGAITSSRPGDQAGTTTLASRIDLDARIERSEGGLLVYLLSGSGEGMEPHLTVTDASIQAVVDSTGVFVNQAFVRTLGSEITVSGTVSTGGATTFSLDLPNSLVSFDELAALFPAFPLRGTGRVTIDASGQPDNFVVSEFRLGSGVSQLSVSGTVVGWPDSATVDLGVRGTPLMADDIKRLLPAALFPERLVVDSLDASGLLAGTLYNRSTQAGGAAFDLRVSGPGGSVDFHGDGRLLAGRRIEVSADVEARSVDLSRIYLSSIGSSTLNGTLAVSVSSAYDSLDTGTLEAVMDGTISRSVLGNANLDLMEVRGTWRGGEGRANANLLQIGGGMTASLEWLSGSQPGFSVEASARNLDLGPLTGSGDLETMITGEMEVSMRRSTDWYGALTMATDSSEISVRGQTSLLGPQTLNVEVSAGESGSAVLLTGSHINGEIDLSHHPSMALRLGRFWGRAFADAAAREMNRPFLGGDVLVTTDDVAAAVLREDLLTALGETVVGSGTIQAENVGDLASWIPGSGISGREASVAFEFAADADQFTGKASLDAPHLGLGAGSAFQTVVSAQVTTGYEGPIEDALEARVDFGADSVATPLATLPLVSASVNLADRNGRIVVRSDRGDRLGPVTLSADAQLLDDRTRLTLDTLLVSARQLDWQLLRGSTIDLYSDAVVVHDLVLQENVQSQRLELNGTLSPVASDTLFVKAQDIRLSEITEFGRLRRELAGSMMADLRITGGFDRPRATGSARIPAFVMDGRLLGDVQLRTDLRPNNRDIGVDLSIMPSPTPSRTPDMTEVVENRLTVTGAFRLPEHQDPGNWDVNVDIQRADLFFLGYIFNESVDRFTGYVAGPATVAGPFSNPIVTADLSVLDGSFGVPRIGVSYTFDGDLRIDQEAIHIERAGLVDQDGGIATISGPLLFNDYRFFSFDLTGSLQDLLVMNRGETIDVPFYGEIRGTGSATLTGPLTNATLRIPDGSTRSDSELFIPLVDAIEEGDASFIIFADSTGRIPDLQRLIRRPFVLARRASSERQFLDGLNMDLNIEAPRGSLIHLVIDPLLGDVINAESTGRVQIRRNQGEFEVFGQMEVLGGDYLFTAGEVFVRRFLVQPGGTISWLGDPVNARLDIPAAYRTRASAAGLEDVSLGSALIPLVVELDITGRVLSPAVDLGLSIDRSNQNALGDYQALEARLNQPDRATEYATSVLLTNSFQLTTDNITAGAGEQLAFNSVSQLVSSQLSRFLDAAIPNVDFSFGLQGERAEDLDITYGVALRLLDERLIIRGEGVYQGSSTDNTRANNQGIQGEFIVEVRLSPSVSAQVFFRREGDILQNADLTNTAGAGLTYQTDFPSWRRVFRRLFGKDDDEEPTPRLTSDGGER